MRSFVGLMAAAAILGTSAPVAAQSSDQGWWDWATPFVASGDGGRVAVPRVPPDDRREEERAQDRQGTGRDDRSVQTAGRGPVQPAAGRGRGGAPSFCRTGAGHPVFGWNWCVERGFARSGDRYRPRWERNPWGDVVLPRWPQQPRESRVNSGTLGTILGDLIFGRLRAQAAALDDGPLEGRWLRPDRGTLVLQVRAGGVPIAELSDLNGDGRADVLLVNGR